MALQDLINAIIHTNGSGLNDKRVYAFPNIPPRKLKGAASGIVSPGVGAEEIIMVADDTTFGGADNGMAITKDGIYFSELGVKPIAVRFEDLIKIIPVSRMGIMTRVKFVFKSGRDMVMPGFVNVVYDYDKLATYLQNVLTAYQANQAQVQADAQAQAQAQAQALAEAQATIQSQQITAQNAAQNEANNAQKAMQEAQNAAQLAAQNAAQAAQTAAQLVAQMTAQNAAQMAAQQYAGFNAGFNVGMNAVGNGSAGFNRGFGQPSYQSQMPFQGQVPLQSQSQFAPQSQFPAQGYAQPGAQGFVDAQVEDVVDSASDSGHLDGRESQVALGYFHPVESGVQRLVGPGQVGRKTRSVRRGAKADSLYADAASDATVEAAGVSAAGANIPEDEDLQRVEATRKIKQLLSSNGAKLGEKPHVPSPFTDDLYVLLTQEYKYCLNSSYGAPKIPVSNLTGALTGIAENQVQPDEVLLVCDATLLGTSDNGLLFTRDKLFYCDLGATPRQLELKDIVKVEAVGQGLDKQGGKGKAESGVTGIRLTLASGERVGLPHFPMIVRVQTFAAWLQAVADMARYEAGQNGDVNAADGADASLNDAFDGAAIRSLEQMPPEVQFGYMQVICNYLLSNDGKVDFREACLFYSLLARLSLDVKQRYRLRLYQASPKNLMGVQPLLKQLSSKLEPAEFKTLTVSLVKDLINIYVQTHATQSFYSGKATYLGEEYLKSSFIVKFAQANGITKEQLRCLQAVVVADSQWCDDKVDDQGVKLALARLISGASAVGINPAALYFSGSVTGLSASCFKAGITSLGLAQSLGLSGNSGLNELSLMESWDAQESAACADERRVCKQTMLFAIKHQLNQSLKMLVEDINIFNAELLKQLRTLSAADSGLGGDKDGQMRSLFSKIAELSVFSQGSKLLMQDAALVEAKAYCQAVPYELNLERLKAITASQAKQAYGREILKLYERIERNGKRVFTRRGDLSADEAKLLSKALEHLGYFAPEV